MYNKKFDGLMVTLASMEEIESWSHGAVDNPDTVNYRTGKPKAGGLFCESIFGPVKNFECSCGKYKGPRYKGIVCEKCNVEVTSSRTRRTRMGHVDLASPLVHAWYKNSPSGGIHQLLQLSSYEIDKILSFVKYIVVKGPTEKGKDFMKKILKYDLDRSLAELFEIYKDELYKLVEDEKKKSKKNEKELEGVEDIIKDLLDRMDKDEELEDCLTNFYKKNSKLFNDIIKDLNSFRDYIIKSKSDKISKLRSSDNNFKKHIDTYEEIDYGNDDNKYSTVNQRKTLCEVGYFKDFLSEDVVAPLKLKFASNLINLSVLMQYIADKDDELKIKNILQRLPSDKKISKLQKEIEEIDERLKNNKNFSNVLDECKKKKDEYKENKAVLVKEGQDLNGIISELEWGKTVSESDYRTFFYKFSNKESLKQLYKEKMLEYEENENHEETGINSELNEILNALKEMESGPDGIKALLEMESGPDGILKALKEIDVEKEIKKKVKEFPNIKSADAKKKSMSLIKLLINLYVSGVKPENMVLRKLPVIPPDLRPVVQLDGGRFASSDVNLFYRRVLMRNIRLKKLVQVGMPDVLKKNEIRLLQESVNNLLVGEKAGAGRSGAGNKVFKSLSDMLSGKEGIFRKNLLGKRVDYSGRSVITVGPGLKLDECGLPIYIAVKVFTPFIIGKLMEKKIVYTPKQAEKLIKDEDPMALRFLEEVIKDKYVLLNRAPTLHRLGIEAFKIKLFPGKTIRLHPLVCGSFNADFDGDQMAIHLPISDEAQKEAKELIASDKNVLKPASGDPTLSLSQDMVLGVYYLMDYFDTRRPEINTEDEWIKNVPVMARYASMQEAYKAYENKEIHIKDKILILNNGKTIETTAGRVIFNMKMPEGLEFINKNMKSKDIKQLLGRVFDEYGMPKTVRLSDDIKDLGFKYSTLAAVSINILDMKIPQDKEEILKEGDKDADVIYKRFYKGFYSEDEKHRLIIDVWTDIKKRVEACLKPIIGAGNNLYTMIDSAARGSQNNVTQICGMKGLVVNPQGEIIELPIKGSFAEGLSPIEYFIAAHSGRKGKADTALRTAESGYLTRKLCDASQEVIIREEDCGSEEYITYSKENAAASGEKFFTQIYGRVLAQDLLDENGVKILDAGIMLGKGEVALIEGNDAVHEVKVRSPITCHCASGVCQKCYGMDLSSRQLVQIGIPVGIIAAQSIGEPSTQLTLNTFHTGGVAGESESDASGIDRIKQLFEVRTPKHPAIIAPFDGTIDFEETPEGGKFGLIKITSDPQKKVYIIKDGYKLAAGVKKGEILVKGAKYAVKGKSELKVEEEGQVLSVDKDALILGVVQTVSHKLFGLLPKKTKSGERVYAGEILTAGAVDIQEYKGIVGDLMAQRYIIREAKKVYSDQGQSLNDKHMEIIVKQLFSKVFIEDSGDSSFIPGTYVKYEDFLKKNEELTREKKTLAKGKRMALGLTTIAKETDSRLSAASFQETIRVMVGASLRGAIDTLSDLKANVIIGRLLPIGENYRNMHGY